MNIYFILDLMRICVSFDFKQYHHMKKVLLYTLDDQFKIETINKKINSVPYEKFSPDT